jgi:hypothetical protein
MIDPITSRVVQAMAGLSVLRLHTIPGFEGYTTGQHTARMHLLGMYLYPQSYAQLAPVITAHDIPEAWVGDIPAPVLRYTNGVRSGVVALETQILEQLNLPNEGDLDEVLWNQFKALDRLELYMTCREAVVSGNYRAQEVIDELERYFEEVGSEQALPGRAFLFFHSYKNVSPFAKVTGIIKHLSETTGGMK